MPKNLLYKSRNFTVEIRQNQKSSILGLYFFNGLVNTRDFPNTIPFLDHHTPGVLKTKCFNYENLAFQDEVKQTELGHLFEHILLDQLCIFKIKKGYKKAVFNGRTYWNWEINPTGTFKIVLDAGKKDKEIFAQAFDRTVYLVELLIENRINSITPTASSLAVEVNPQKEVHHLTD